ncbi:hypothetical protein Rhe02_08770 [Rhizocola hellebori]|uniref:Tyr recombinase domain-containing protein n=1 Tax=Rhizocola hellebori TaxID=1392758 RepID=A0A8J3Q3Z3_9ACTN|nr:hypothetical protein Rhe02_08770 [Rhizocola hellebori]
MFNTAVKEDELLRSNPCRIKGFDKYHTPERHTPTLMEVRALSEEMPAQFYALIMLAAYSGLRWGELAALRRCDLDLAAGTVKVHRNLVSVAGQAGDRAAQVRGQQANGEPALGRDRGHAAPPHAQHAQ